MNLKQLGPQRVSRLFHMQERVKRVQVEETDEESGIPVVDYKVAVRDQARIDAMVSGIQAVCTVQEFQEMRRQAKDSSIPQLKIQIPNSVKTKVISCVNADNSRKSQFHYYLKD